MSNTQQKAYNIAPYYDDFDHSKGFHQIMFRPGISVQARELIQLQTILRDQFKKFGDHVFQQGSVVIPGNSYYDFNATSVKLQSNYLGSPIVVGSFLNQIVVGVTTGVEAIVRAAIPVEGSDPATIILDYVAAGPDGTSGFEEGEEIYVKKNISIRALIGTTEPFNPCALAFINDGVYYVNGTFAQVAKQSVVISKYSNTPSAHVLLEIIESIVTSDDDQSLLDPAQGEPNYAAPGADRLKIELKLVTLPIGAVLSDDYVEIMRFESGVLVYHSKTPKYSELEKSLARRTYDESGDYLVEGLAPTLLEHIREEKTYGAFFPPYGDRNKFVLQLSPGKAYIKGFEKEKIAKTVLELPKARTADHIKNKEASVVPSFGQVVFVTNLKKLPDIMVHETVLFYNDNDPNELSAINVGSAKSYAIEYKEGQGIYSLYIYDMTFNGSYTFEDVGGIRFGVGGSATVLQKLTVPNATGQFAVNEIVSFGDRSATMAYHDILSSTAYVFKHLAGTSSPKIGDSIVGATSSASSVVRDKQTLMTRGELDAPIIPIPMAPLARVRDANDAVDISYRVYKYLTILTDASGNGSVNIDVGRIDSITQGNLVASWTGGLVSLNLFDLSSTGTTLLLAGGPISTTVYVQAVVTKVAAGEKTKTVMTHVESAITLSGTTTKFHILAKADIYKLVSVVSSLEGDVTSKFTLDNGQRNYIYDYGKITLNASTVPTGTLTITYQYFEHSTSGDYFTVDSYRNSGIADPLALDFVGNVPSYYSQSSSKFYDLKACYDFRKIIGFVGDALVNESRITASVDYYVGRIDVYGINISGDIVHIQGIPEEIPEYPKVPDDTLVLGSYDVPAWTSNIKAIRLRRERVQRYTMRDINNLALRLDNLEEFVTLSALESDAAKMSIVDPITGLDRYKMGILVDNFSDPEVISDFHNAKFAAEYEDAVLKPAKEWVATEWNFEATTSTNFRRTGNVVTLPYTDVEFVVQPYSTKITNVNPFLVISWVGNMTLSPASDSWVETENLPDIINTLSTVTTVTRTLNDGTHPLHDGRIASIVETTTATTTVNAPGTDKPIQTPSVSVSTNVLAMDPTYWEYHTEAVGAEALINALK